MLADIADLEQRLEASDGAVRSLLRITAPVESGQSHVAPRVNESLNEHAAIRVELNLSDQIVPLLDERLDLALRIGTSAPRPWSPSRSALPDW
ncbi:LysR family transcriptional regulator [Pseudomonas sp. MT-1]|nr:LysR family transcriptional regulator [Pseudomonas sp. MT-1]